MSDRPKPPPGYATWLDYVLEDSEYAVRGEHNARAELAEMREKIRRMAGLLAEVRIKSDKGGPCVVMDYGSGLYPVRHLELDWFRAKNAELESME